MAFKRITYPKGTSPKGVAVFPHLNKPDAKFNPDKPVYKTNLRVPEADAQELIGRIEALMAALSTADAKVLALLSDAEGERLKKAGKKARPADLPYGQSSDREGGDIDGFIDFKFKANAEFKKQDGSTVKRALPLFDAKGKQTTAEVWGGSEIKVSYSLRPWVNAKSEYGVKLGLEAVQIITLRSGGGGQDAAGFGFGEEDGFEAEDNSTAMQSTEDQSAPVADDGDGDF